MQQIIVMKIEEQINKFNPISLDMMDRVKLMNRVDVKYIFSESILPHVLERISDHYFVLDTSSTRIASYQTLYFDTKKNKFYLHHHNGKRNRFKVRYRKYIESELTFFEVKYKNNKGRVIKDRIEVEDIKEELGEKELALVLKKMKKSLILEPRLENKFNRITLISKNGIERLTIDFNLSFLFNKVSEGMPDLAIAEIKQERYSRDSKIMEVFRQFGLRPERMSKYAIGMSIFSGEKANNFKAKRIRINKITQHDV